MGHDLIKLANTSFDACKSACDSAADSCFGFTFEDNDPQVYCARTVANPRLAESLVSDVPCEC
eukprot:SAG11_NODE_192_length_12931_cov_5.747682_8_plen_63_part_00